MFLAFYLNHQLFEDATRLDFAFISSLSLVMTFLVLPLATIFTQRYGVRRTMSIGIVLETVSLFCASGATQLWHLFLSEGVLFGLGLGMMSIPTTTVIPQWCTTKRSLTSGIAVSGAGLGGLVYSRVAQALIRDLGLAWAFRILAIVAYVINVTCVLLLRDRRSLVKVSWTQAAVELSLHKDRSFDLFFGFSWFTIFGYFILIFSLASYSIDIGVRPSQASLVACLFN